MVRKGMNMGRCLGMGWGNMIRIGIYVCGVGECLGEWSMVVGRKVLEVGWG